jgi:hypothetical protein
VIRKVQLVLVLNKLVDQDRLKIRILQQDKPKLKKLELKLKRKLKQKKLLRLLKLMKPKKNLNRS